METENLSELIAELVLSKKAKDVLILDLREVFDVTDFFVICTGESDTQIKAISDAVIKGLKDVGIRAWHTEGQQALKWVLIDYVDVVVHIFMPEEREFYRLESLWCDAKFREVEDELSEITGS